MRLKFCEDWRGYRRGYEGYVPALLGRRALAHGVAIRVERIPRTETAMTGPLEHAARRISRPDPRLYGAAGW